MTSRCVTLLLAATIVLVQLPVLLGNESTVTPITVCVFVAGIGWALVRNESRPSWLFLAVLAFVIVLSVALKRGVDARVGGSSTHAAAQAATYAVVVIFAFLAIGSATDGRTRHERLIALALAPAVYALANALAHMAGLESRADVREGIATLQPASLLGWFGISMNRVQFPLATGVNTTGIVAGAGLAACLALLPTRRWYLWPCAAGCLYCLALGDNRVSLLVAAIAGTYLGWAKRLVGARLVALAVPLLPLVLIGMVRLLDGVFATSLSRGGDDFTTIGNRRPIWDAAWETITGSPAHALYGWGTNGHVTSGASTDYYFLFSSLPNPLGYSTHNAVFQNILEIGFIGLLLLVVITLATSGRLVAYAREDRPVAAALMAGLAVLLLGGATEAAPASGSEEITVAALAICAATAALSRPASKPDPAPLETPADTNADMARSLALAAAGPRRDMWA